MGPDDHQGDDPQAAEPEVADRAVRDDLADVFFRVVAGKRDEDR